MTNTLQGIKIGNFVRQDLQGRDTLLYGIALGQLVLLIHGPAGEVLANLERMEQAAVELQTKGTLLLVLSGEPREAKMVADKLPCATILVDTDCAVHEYLTQAKNQPLAFTMLDRLLRITDSGPFEPGAISSAIGAAHGVSRQPPPILQLPTVLTPAECNRLIDHYRQQQAVSSPSHVFRDGEVFMEPDPKQKSRMDHLVDNTTLSNHLMQIVSARLLPEVQMVFNFSPKGAERFKIVAYDAEDGGHFATHRDNVTPDASNRRFAVTVNLNTDEYRGGGLVFPEYDQAPISPEAGGAVVFSCSLAHQVLPVTHGTRYALITFLTI